MWISLASKIYVYTVGVYRRHKLSGLKVFVRSSWYEIKGTSLGYQSVSVMIWLPKLCRSLTYHSGVKSSPVQKGLGE